MKISIPWIIILALIAVIFGMAECNHEPIQKIGKEHTTVQQKDSFAPPKDTGKHIIRIQGKAIHDTQYISVPVPAQVDTAAILAQYYAKRVYRNVISDSNLQGLITDTISQNAIQSRVFDYKIIKPDHYIIKTITKTDTLEPLKPWLRVLVGVQGGVNASGFNSFQPGALLMTRRDHEYYAGYDLLSKSWHAGAYFKIHL